MEFGMIVLVIGAIASAINIAIALALSNARSKWHSALGWLCTLVLFLGAMTQPAKADVFLEVGTGYHTSFGSVGYEWQDDGSPGFYGAIRWEGPRIGKLGGWQLFGQYAHHSNVWAPPSDESSLDQFIVGLRWKLL